MLRCHTCAKSFQHLLQPIAAGAMSIAVRYARTKGHLLGSVVVGTVGIEGGHYDRNLRLRSGFGLLATAGNPKEYTQQKEWDSIKRTCNSQLSVPITCSTSRYIPPWYP